MPAPTPPEVRARVLAAVEQIGPFLVRVAEATGLPYNVVRGVADRQRPDYRAAAAAWRARQGRVGADNPEAAAWQARRDAAAAEVDARVRDDEAKARLYEWLRPVELPPLERVPVAYAPANVGIVFSDVHAPVHDPRVLAILGQCVEALQPAWVGLNGDGPDMLALSKYPKDARAGRSWALRDEQRAMKTIWRDLAALGAPWGMRLWETEANHSGNQLASRWRRYLNERCPELFGLDGFEELVTYERFFHPADVAVELVDEWIVSPEAENPLRILHGFKANQHGGYTARATADAVQGSVMVGHTHRQGYNARRIPALIDRGAVIRPEGQRRAWEIGCCFDLPRADYAPAADWCQGFAIVTWGGGADPAVELVTVTNGAANVAALGRTVRA